MTTDLKIKTLRRLANTPGTTPLEVLERECASVEAVLSSDTQYDVLEEHLKLLSAFAFRVSPRSVRTIVSFIDRLKTLEVSYPEDGLIPAAELTQYQNPESLTLDAIEILIGLRYLEPEAIFNELLELSLHESDKIRKTASEGVSNLAEYNLSVFSGTDQQQGIGAAPQKNIIDRIERFDDEMVIKHFRTLNDTECPSLR